MKLGAHAHNNMGIRTSSMGDVYPYIVYATGNPHSPAGVVWRVMQAGGAELPGCWNTAAGAEAQAARWKELDELERVEL